MIPEAAILCLSLTLYHEGLKQEPIEGLFAIGQTVLTRAERKPEKVCVVVRQYKQFSWTLKPPRVEDGPAWRTAQAVARLTFHMQDFTGGATHFHAVFCNQDRAHECKPYWRSDMEPLGQWGSHIFYKEKGKR